MISEDLVFFGGMQWSDAVKDIVRDGILVLRLRTQTVRCMWDGGLQGHLKEIDS